METIEKQLQAEPRNYQYMIFISIILTGLFIWSVSTVELKQLQSSGLQIAANIISGIFNPNIELLVNFTKNGVPYLLIETIAIAFLGTIIGAILAIPLAFLSSSNVVPKPIAFLTKILLIAIRTIPAIIYGLMFIRVTGPGPFAGVLTMSLTSIGMLSKLYADVIEDLDISVLGSMTSIGCSLFKKFVTESCHSFSLCSYRLSFTASI